MKVWVEEERVWNNLITEYHLPSTYFTAILKAIFFIEIKALNSTVKNKKKSLTLKALYQ